MSFYKFIVIISIFFQSGNPYSIDLVNMAMNKNNRNLILEKNEGKEKNDNHEVIPIKGTVIGSNRGFFNKRLYSSCLVEVNTCSEKEIRIKDTPSIPKD